LSADCYAAVCSILPTIFADGVPKGQQLFLQLQGIIGASRSPLGKLASEALSTLNALRVLRWVPSFLTQSCPRTTLGALKCLAGEVPWVQATLLHSAVVRIGHMLQGAAFSCRSDTALPMMEAFFSALERAEVVDPAYVLLCPDPITAKFFSALWPTDLSGQRFCTASIAKSNDYARVLYFCDGEAVTSIGRRAGVFSIPFECSLLIEREEFQYLCDCLQHESFYPLLPEVALVPASWAHHFPSPPFEGWTLYPAEMVGGCPNRPHDMTVALPDEKKSKPALYVSWRARALIDLFVEKEAHVVEVLEQPFAPCVCCWVCQGVAVGAIDHSEFAVLLANDSIHDTLSAALLQGHEHLILVLTADGPSQELSAVSAAIASFVALYCAPISAVTLPTEESANRFIVRYALHQLALHETGCHLDVFPIPSWLPAFLSCYPAMTPFSTARVYKSLVEGRSSHRPCDISACFASRMDALRTCKTVDVPFFTKAVHRCSDK
jgi:hypothetical protein